MSTMSKNYHECPIPKSLHSLPVLQAKQKKCDMIVFGHTHQYFEREIDGIMFLNPGNLKGRLEWKTQSYMLIDFNDDGSIDIIKKRFR